MSSSTPSAESQALMRRGTELLAAYYGKPEGTLDLDLDLDALAVLDDEKASPQEVIYDLTALLVASQLMIQNYAHESGHPPLEVLRRLAAVLQVEG